MKTLVIGAVLVAALVIVALNPRTTGAVLGASVAVLLWTLPVWLLVGGFLLFRRLKRQ